MVYPNSSSYPQIALFLKWEQENSIKNFVEIIIAVVAVIVVVVVVVVVVAIINWLRESWPKLREVCR